MEIEIKTVKLKEIKLNSDNPRRISNQDMDRLVKSLQAFPDMLSIREIVVDETMTCLGGNMRTLALRKAGAKETTAKIVTGLTAEQKREFTIKDNGMWGSWNMDELSAWDDLPLIDWGVKIPEAWGKLDEPSLMAKNFNDGKGLEYNPEGGEVAPGKYPVTFILDQSEWEKWETVKAGLKIQGDKAAFLKMIGGGHV
jgi:hypothetical protein